MMIRHLCHWLPTMAALAGHHQIPTACGGRSAQGGWDLPRVLAAAAAAAVAAAAAAAAAQQWVCEKCL